MELKVGDYITCIKTGYMSHSCEAFAYVGKDYQVTHVSGKRIMITSETGPGHNWTLDDEFFEYFSIGEKTPWEGSVIKFNFT